MAELRNTADDLWSERHAHLDESENYGPGLAGYLMRKSHSLVEAQYGSQVHFSRVLEVGAGSGVLSHVKHSFDEYVLTDAHDAMLAQLATQAVSPRGRRGLPPTANAPGRALVAYG